MSCSETPQCSGQYKSGSRPLGLEEATRASGLKVLGALAGLRVPSTTRGVRPHRSRMFDMGCGLPRNSVPTRRALSTLRACRRIHEPVKI